MPVNVCYINDAIVQDACCSSFIALCYNGEFAIKWDRNGLY